MKAAVFHGAHDIRIEEVDGPPPLGSLDVLLRPYWCGICGTDLHEYAMGPIVIPSHPHPLTGATAPQILGHEFSAEVLEVGSGVRSVRVGQRVSVMPLLYCGSCYYCRRGLNHLCQSMACVGLSFASGGISGFSNDKFVFSTTNFANNLGSGSFFMSQGNAGLSINFTPVPEPSTYLLLAMGLAVVTVSELRRRKK